MSDWFITTHSKRLQKGDLKKKTTTHKQIKTSIHFSCIWLLEDHWKEKEKKKEFQASKLVYN